MNPEPPNAYDVGFSNDDVESFVENEPLTPSDVAAFPPVTVIVPAISKFSPSQLRNLSADVFFKDSFPYLLPLAISYDTPTNTPAWLYPWIDWPMEM